MNKEMKITPVIESSLPILEFGFDEIKSQLTEEMSKYQDIVVTHETLKADKKLAQELKAKGNEFNKQRIEKVKEISKPIEMFTSQMNDLKNICIESSKIISDQVAVFENEALVDIGVLLTDTLEEMRNNAGINKEFRSSGLIEPLTKLGAVTAKGALNKGSKDKLTAIVADELALQQKVDYRLLQLESESHKANLHTPLVRLNVEPFLFESDDIYQEKLEEVVASELERQRLADENIKASQEELPAIHDVIKSLSEQFGGEETVTASETNQVVQPVDNASYAYAAENQEVTEDEYDAYAEQMMQEQSQHQQDPAIQLKDGHVLCIATATFKVSVPNEVSEEMVQEKLIKMMVDAGVTSLDSLQVRKTC